MCCVPVANSEKIVITGRVDYRHVSLDLPRRFRKRNANRIKVSPSVPPAYPHVNQTPTISPPTPDPGTSTE